MSIRSVVIRLTRPLAPCLLACAASVAADQPTTLLLGIGDSLTNGTMDATINTTNTQNAYLQKVADALGEVTPVVFTQPLLDDLTGERASPLSKPTNLAVDGADIFSAEGYEYYKRGGVDQSYLSDDYLCDRYVPRRLDDLTDRILYPLSVLTLGPVSSMDGLDWWLERLGTRSAGDRAALVLWLGNNDTSGGLGVWGGKPVLRPDPPRPGRRRGHPGPARALDLGRAYRRAVLRRL